jgi:hypothetical protein
MQVDFMLEFRVCVQTSTTAHERLGEASDTSAKVIQPDNSQ